MHGERDSETIKEHTEQFLCAYIDSFIFDLGLIPGLGRSPVEGKGTHSSILAWRIPWTV